MIIDCFQYNNELDLLKLRCEELGDVVDAFVPVSAEVDHQGNAVEVEPIPQALQDQYHIFPKTLSLREFVGDVKIPKRPECEETCAGYQSWRLYTSFMIEHWHRNQIRWIIAEHGCEDETIVMVSDVDEIPSREVVASQEIGVVAMHSFYYKLNLLADEPIIGTLKYPWWWWKAQPSIQYVREARYRLTPRLHGGWHFTWLAKSAEDVQRKFSMIAHTELATEENARLLPERFNARVDPFGRWPERPLRVTGLRDLPRPVREHPEQWAALLDKSE
jgi:beta-1,4-mannosyl-glycoprotein beta-1,4-N-acetylglucosaminyltransferase